MRERDVVIVGGGATGYTSAIRVLQLGGKATLIENDAVGGTCLNRGCIPARTLIWAAEFLDMGKEAKSYGVIYPGPAVDFPKMMARKDTVVKTLVSGVKLLLDGNGVEVIEGKGKLFAPSQLEVCRNGGTKESLTAAKIILATGSKNKQVSFPGEEAVRVFNTTQALEHTEVPQSMLIVGGGVLG